MAGAYVNGYYSLVLDGFDCGIVSKVGGGGISAEVVKFAQSTEYLERKHLGNLKYEGFDISCGLAMGEPLKAWIQQTLDAAHTKKNGSLQSMNFNREVVQEREFMNALITEVGFPKLDASSKEPGQLTVKWQPEYIRAKKGGKDKVTKPVKGNQKQFKPENFRITLDGCDNASKFVKTIDALTIKQTTKTDDIGDARDYELCGGKLEMPDLKITLAEAYADELVAWHENFVIMGKNTEADEKTFLIEYLDQSRANVLLAIKGVGCGIHKLSADAHTNNQDNIRVVTAEIYCEQITVESWAA